MSSACSMSVQVTPAPGGEPSRRDHWHRPLALGGSRCPPQPSFPRCRPDRPEDHGELPRAEGEARVHRVEHRLPLERHRRHLGLLREGAVLGLGARDAAAVPHRQHLSCPLAGRVRGRQGPPPRFPPGRGGILWDPVCWTRGAQAGAARLGASGPAGARSEAPGPCLPPGAALSSFPVCTQNLVPVSLTRRRTASSWAPQPGPPTSFSCCQ